MFSWLSGGVIRDILRPDVEGLIKLLEECLKAEKQFVLSVFESVASALQDLRFNENEAKAICNEIFFDDSTLKSILCLPFFLKQKLLVTGCKHHTKKVFGDSKEKPLIISLVDAFTVNGKASPTIYDESYAEDEVKEIMNGTLRRYLMKTSTSLPLDCLTHASSADGLTTDNYDQIDDKHVDACYVASKILQTNVFSFIWSKMHV